MSEGERTEFINHIAQLTKGADPKDVAGVMQRWIQFYADEKISLPEPTLKFYARVPQALAYIATSDLTPEASNSVTAIKAMMTRVDRADYLAVEKQTNKNEFKQTMLEALQEFGIVGERTKSSSLAVVYLKKYPDQFKELVLDNTVGFLESVEQRHTLALDLLKYMGEAAEVAIPRLDTAGGYRNFNALINELHRQVNKREPENPLSLLERLLIARFKYAPLKHLPQSPVYS